MVPDRTILLVEDNPDHLELTMMALQESGIDSGIVTARDGVEALDYLFAQGKHAGRDTRRQPALVLLDLKLPKLSGLDVLKRIRDNPATALVPVVILTSASEGEDILACYRAGANSFVRKPVDFAEYNEKLGALQAYWLQISESPPLPH